MFSPNLIQKSATFRFFFSTVFRRLFAFRGSDVSTKFFFIMKPLTHPASYSPALTSAAES